MNKNPTTSKRELLNRTDNYFSVDENSWMCLDDFIEDHCPKGYRENKGWIIGVANYLQNTAKYNYEIQETTGYYIIKISPSYRWDKENLFKNKFRTIVLTAIITGAVSLLVHLYLKQAPIQLPSQKDLQQDTTLYNLSGEVKKLQVGLKDIHDTVAKYNQRQLRLLNE